jgi:hypothetical protein
MVKEVLEQVKVTTRAVLEAMGKFDEDMWLADDVSLAFAGF